MLMALGNYGGPTSTQPPELGSPVIDAGNPDYLPGEPVELSDPTETLERDQRGEGFLRVVDDGDDVAPYIDIGAVEFQVQDTSDCALLGDYNDDGIVDARDYVVWRKNFGQDYQLANEDPLVSPGKVTHGDYLVWQEHFGETCGNQLPEVAIVPHDFNGNGSADANLQRPRK